MPSPQQSSTRRTRHLRVPVTLDEEQQIKAQAHAAGLSVAAFLRTVGLGYPVTGIVDNRRVEELVRINADQESLAELLLLWLTSDPRTKNFGEPTMRAVLAKLEDTQAQMNDVIRAIILPRAQR